MPPRELCSYAVLECEYYFRSNLCGLCRFPLTERRKCGSFSLQGSVAPLGSSNRKILSKYVNILCCGATRLGFTPAETYLL